MVTRSDILKFDQQKLMEIYEKWPEHFARAGKLTINPVHDLSHYDSIAFCGMGGSATAGDILNDFLQSSSPIPSNVVKGQKIPSFVGTKSLVIVSSISGNTQETLLMAKEAREKNAEVICISSGGTLQSFANDNGLAYLRIPNLGLPRASLPYLLMPCLNFIKDIAGIKLEFNTILKDLEATKRKILLSVHDKINPAKSISNFFRDGFAVCFTSPALLSVGTRFKDSLNENAKVHCLRESVLEASHNEIVPFTYKPELNPKLLLLRWKNDSIFVKERFEKLKILFGKISQPYMELYVLEDNIMNAVISTVYLLDFATIYMALSRGIDPSPTPAIDILKQL